MPPLKTVAKFQPHAAAPPVGPPAPDPVVTPPEQTKFDAEVRKRIALGWDPEEATIGARAQIESDERSSKNAKA